MNTPAHAVANLLILGRRDRPREVMPIAAGALLPDVPMLVFYAWQKLAAVPEAEIWSQAYHDPRWQAFFDLFNSLPLIVLALLVARLASAPRWSAFFASMGLHALADLPLHNGDAHRHLWPLSDWRFASPVSYWDPAHHGQWAGLAEIALVAVGSVWLWRRYPQAGPRGLVAALALVYLLYWGFVALVWM